MTSPTSPTSPNKSPRIDEWHDDILTPILTIVVLSLPKDDVQHTDIMQQAKLSLVCKRFKAAVEKLPLRVYIDGLRKLNMWICFTSTMNATQTREKSIFRLNMVI
jgi:hypothetical protein